jgi:putative transposase
VIRQAQGLSERRACRLVGMARTSCRYEPQRQGEEEKLKARLRSLAGERRRFGYRRLTVLLRREGWAVNHKRVYRLYRQEGLGVRRRKRKRIGAVERQPLAIPTRQNERWSMDFISDALSEGRKFRSLNIVDDFNRECLAAEVDTSITGARVVRVLERLRERRGNKLALACGVGWVGIVEGAGSTGFSVGFSAFFFCSPSARRPSSVRILNYPAVAIGCHRGGS